MENKKLLEIVDEKVENLKTFIKSNTQNDINMVTLLLSMVSSSEYLDIAENFLIPLKQKGENFKSLVDGMLQNFNIKDTEETRIKLNKYLEFFCSAYHQLSSNK